MSFIWIKIVKKSRMKFVVTSFKENEEMSFNIFYNFHELSFFITKWFFNNDVIFRERRDVLMTTWCFDDDKFFHNHRIFMSTSYILKKLSELMWNEMKWKETIRWISMNWFFQKVFTSKTITKFNGFLMWSVMNKFVIVKDL